MQPATADNVATFNIRQLASALPVSKHRQFDPQTGAHIPGRVRFGNDTGLRKLMRAARQGKVPSERIQTIMQAQVSAVARAPEYMSAHARRAAGWHHDGKRWFKFQQPEPELMPTIEAPTVKEHDSDCAVHNEPASSNGPCDCGVEPAEPARQSKVYGVKSNAARAAAKHGLSRADVFEVLGGFAFNVPA